MASLSKIFNKYRDDFFRNLPFKVAAVLIAVILWFVILNIVDPPRPHTEPLTLVLRNQHVLASGPAYIFLENAAELGNIIIEVTLRGNTQNIEALRANLEAYVDLSTADIIHGASLGSQLPATVQLAGNFGDVDIISIQPSSVILNLDTIITREFEVEFEQVGSVDDDFIAIWDSADISPKTINLTGPSTEINRIDRLLLEVDMQGLDSHLEINNIYPLLIDAAGNLTHAENISFSDAVSAKVPVYRRGVARFAVPTYGSPSAGFGVAAVNLTPASFDVAGPSEVIAALGWLQPTPISSALMEEATASFSVRYNINNYLPDGVFLIDRMQNIATANVVIEPILQRTFTVLRGNINVVGMPPNFHQILTEQVSFTISALESILDEMIVVPVVTANLAGRAEGQHQIGLTVDLPQGATLVGAMPSLSVFIAGDAVEENGYYDEPPTYENDDDQVSYDEEYAYYGYIDLND